MEVWGRTQVGKLLTGQGKPVRQVGDYKVTSQATATVSPSLLFCQVHVNVLMKCKRGVGADIGVGGDPYKRLIKIMRKEKACSAVSLLINSFIKNRRAQRA